MVKIEAPGQELPGQELAQESSAAPNIAPSDAAAPQVKLGNISVDSEAITEDGISSGLSDVAEVSAGEVKSGFASAPPIPDSHLSDQTTLAGPPPAWQDNENWQSPKTRRTRHIVMIATIALSTLSVTVLTFGWFLRLQESKSSSVAQTSETPTSETPIKATESALSDATEPAQSIAAETEGSVPLLESTPDSDVFAAESVLVPDTPTESVNETLAMEEEAGTAQTIIPSSLIPTSPIEPTDGEVTADDDVPTMKELPSGLRQFIPMLLQEGPIEETSLAAPPSINQVEIDAAAEEDSNTLGIEPPKPINLKRDLGFKVAFNSNGYPLPSLLLLISEMTGVPIQIDWTSFDLAGVDVAKPIKVVGKARTCRDWLDTIAKQVDAEVREKEFVIVMTLTDQAFTKAETVFLDLADFADQSKSAEQVIQQFMGPEIQAAKIAPKQAEQDEIAGQENADEDDEASEQPKPQIPVDVMAARERQQLQILATEMLRRMRSIRPKLPDDRSSRWMQISDDRYVDWQPIRNVDPKELKPGSQPDTPITTAAMLRQISTINESVCLVNWYDANRRGMRPTRLVMPNAKNVSAAEMLSSILDPLSMEVRRVDTNHWWVGSNATYDRLPVLVHSDRLGQQRDDYVRQIDKIMSANPDAVYRSAYDSVSDRMLMLLPRYVARQLFKVSQEIAKK